MVESLWSVWQPAEPAPRTSPLMQTLDPNEQELTRQSLFSTLDALLSARADQPERQHYAASGTDDVADVHAAFTTQEGDESNMRDACIHCERLRADQLGREEEECHHLATWPLVAVQPGLHLWGC